METTHPKSRAAWRAWLKKHHAKKSEIWLVYFKKHTGKARVAYADAVEEAICFGWIDSTVKRIDDDRYAQRFCPRRKKSRWSALNVQRAERMLAAGAMTRAGKSAFEQRNLATPPPDIQSAEIPRDVEKALKRKRGAWAAFRALPPSHRKQYLGWIQTAKRAETRKRRIAKAVEAALVGKKPIEL